MSEEEPEYVQVDEATSKRIAAYKKRYPIMGVRGLIAGGRDLLLYREERL